MGFQDVYVILSFEHPVPTKEKKKSGGEREITLSCYPWIGACNDPAYQNQEAYHPYIYIHIYCNRCYMRLINYEKSNLL